MLAIGLLITFGIVLNPIVTSMRVVDVGMLAGEGCAALALLAYEFLRAYRRDRERRAQGTIDQAVDRATVGPTTRLPSWRAILLFGLIALIWGIANRERWEGQAPYSDDGYYIGTASDWQTTRDNLWRRFNEHFIVPQRLISFLVVAAGKRIGLPTAMQLSGAVLYVVLLALLFELARRRWRSEFAALLAVTLFALSTSYGEVIHWYSAGLWQVTVIILLAALLVLESDDPEPDRWRIATSAILSFVAPFSYSLGLLVGPLASVWLAVRIRAGGWRRRLGMALLPTMGTLLWVGWQGPGMLAWFRTREYTATSSEGLRAFDPLGAIAYSVQLTIDKLALGTLGCPVPLQWKWGYLLLFPLAPLALRWLLRLRPDAWQLAPMIAMIVLPYAITLPFRTKHRYVEILDWDRYQLIPQIGVALLIVGTVALLHPAFVRGEHGRLTGPQWRLVGALAALLLLFRELGRLVAG